MTNIILFGDSILAGYRSGHETALITNACNKTGLGHFVNASLPGATTLEALDLWQKRVTSQADCVIVAFGTNDCSAIYGIPPEAYTHNLTSLVQQIGCQRVRLIGPSAVDPKRAPDHTWERTHRFNEIAKKVAYDNKLPFLDLIAKMPIAKLDLLLQNDGIHYTDVGNALLVKNLSDLVQQNRPA